MTDWHPVTNENRHNPVGHWAPGTRGGFRWISGSLPGPDDWAVKNWGYAKATDYSHLPDGSKNPSYDPDEPITDVKPPALEQLWGYAPDIPSAMVYGGSDGTAGGGGADQPYTRFSVHTGSIRDAENTILVESNKMVVEYGNLREMVLESASWDFTGGGDPADNHKVKMIQDNLLTGVAGVIHLAGVFTAKLNDAAQVYAKADAASEPPEAVA
ncbi:hypothetical protein [Dactylosporangium sp. CA-092794]|uniref:hypothetical protein n=1 Tax=Dactylosporangium sp. CA-092794 TaxID=3239929 RepID=UPI003D91AF54